jgi:hypothetical protein
VQYGFARVDYNNITKLVLVGWVGEGVPEQTKGYFNAHYATVAKYFHGYHVQITARSSNDLSPQVILQKVDGASGSKYSGGRTTVPLRPKYSASTTGASEEDWGDAPQIKQQEHLTTVASAYQPTKVDMHSLRNIAKPAPSAKTSALDQPQGSYQPIGKVDIAARQAQAKESKFANDRPAPLQSAYQPVGKVDIAAIRAKGAPRPVRLEEKPVKAPEPKPPAPEPENDYGVVEEKPKSLKERMAAFSGSRAPATTIGADADDEEPKLLKDRVSVYSGSGRLTEMPKPKVSHTVGSRFAAAAGPRGTAPAIPSDLFGSETGPGATAGFKDFGSEGGKSPAQIWAEKHAKKQPVEPVYSERVGQPAQPPREVSPQPSQPEEYEKPDISALRSQFAATSVEREEPRREPELEPEPEQQEEQETRSFADLTSRFAKSVSPPVQSLPPRAPVRPVEPEPEPEIHVTGKPEEEEGTPPPPAHHDIGREESIAAALSESQPIESTVDSHVHDKAEPLPVGYVAVVAYNYDKDEDNEISLVEGEVVTEIEKVDPDWWFGKNSKGESGLFPSNYVELTEIAPNHPGAITEVEDVARRVEESAKPGPSALAEYDYEAQEEGELSFPENALITDIEFVDEAWWSGVYNGERGLLPSNYVVLQ